MSQPTLEQPARIGIVTVSDRASRGDYADAGGPAVREYLANVLTCPFQAVSRVIADDRETIESVLKELCDLDRCGLVVTTGGTGPSPRDVTPEATEAVCEKVVTRFRRVDAPGQPGESVDGDSVAANGGHSAPHANCESAGSPAGHCRVLGFLYCIPIGMRIVTRDSMTVGTIPDLGTCKCVNKGSLRGLTSLITMHLSVHQLVAHVDSTNSSKAWITIEGTFGKCFTPDSR